MKETASPESEYAHKEGMEERRFCQGGPREGRGRGRNWKGVTSQRLGNDRFQKEAQWAVETGTESHVTRGAESRLWDLTTMKYKMRES